MSYKALYRAYRPQSFEEVAGQKHIIRTLKNALEVDKIAHAYLFCGPRGTGKTTMAKLFAKALNCEEGIGHQCNKCDNCLEISNGTHPDVIEIDAASNNGVEQVRELIDKVNYLPIKGKYKIYIIDEVHMMTDNAFNALLKTLEEPPAHVIFILATTEPHSILPTIISRCQRYDFTKVSDGDIYERLIEVLNKENVQYEKEAINAIIALADGGMRDALSILDQVLAYSGNTLKEEDVNALFGLAGIDEKLDFIKAIYNGDVSTCLNKINAFNEGGVDLKRLTIDLLDILKDVLIVKKIKDDSQLSTLKNEQAENLANLIDIRSLNEMISTLLKAQSDYKSVNNIKTMFEVIILRLATMHDEINEKPIDSKIKNNVVTETKTVIIKQEEVKKEEVPVPQKPIKTEMPSWQKDDSLSGITPLIEDGKKYDLSDDLIIKLMVIGNKDARIELINHWGELDSLLCHPTLGNITSLIKNGTPKIVTNDIVVLEYDFAKMVDKVNIKANQKSISKILSKLAGHDVFIYAITRSNSVRLVKSFFALRQISKLPKASDIKISIEEISK